MDATDRLKQVAIEIARGLQDSAAGLKNELAELKARAALLESQVQSADLGRDRALNFEPTYNGELQCPRCWVLRDVRADMKPIPGTDRKDFFRCRNCQFEFPIEANEANEA